jgi:hypothetical protein
VTTSDSASSASRGDVGRAGQAARHHVGEEQPAAEGAQPAGDRVPDVAEPDDADGERPQLPSLADALIRPLAVAHPAVGAARVPDQGEDGHHGPVGHGVAVVARRVGDRDAELCGRPVVDGVVADGWLLDELAAGHRRERVAVESMSVPLVSEDDVRICHRLTHCIRRRGWWNEHYLSIVLGPEEAADHLLRVWAQGGYPDGHECECKWQTRFA